jgi:Mg2+/Co2+ transporter CorB
MRARPPPRGGMTVAGLIFLFAVVVALSAFSALFSGLETALFSLKAHQLRRLRISTRR